MSFGTRFMNEYYACSNCGENLSESQVNKNWKCPDCDVVVSIYTTDDNHVYQRKMGQDIIKWDSVKLPGYEETYDVLDARKQDGKYRIALKGYRTISLEKNRWLNCMYGSWDGNVSKFKE